MENEQKFLVKGTTILIDEMQIGPYGKLIPIGEDIARLMGEGLTGPQAKKKVLQEQEEKGAQNKDSSS